MNKRDLQAKQTREKLVHTSKQLITKYGYNQVSVSRICQECKIAKGTFYIYFTSKKDIIHEILADINILMFSRKWNLSGTARQRLEEYTHTYLEMIQLQGMDFTREALKIMMDEKIEYKTVYADKHIDMVEGILNDGKAAGEIDQALDVAFFRRGLQNMFFGIMLDWCSSRLEIPVIEFGERTIQGWMKLIFKV